jgi:hypothetical protein
MMTTPRQKTGRRKSSARRDIRETKGADPMARASASRTAKETQRDSLAGLSDPDRTRIV